MKVLAKKTKMRRPVEIFWNTIRINMLETETKKSDSGVISCEVTKPTPKEIIKRLALRDWKLKTMPVDIFPTHPYFGECWSERLACAVTEPSVHN